MKVFKAVVRTATLKQMAAPCAWSNCKATITRHEATFEYRRSVSTGVYGFDERPRKPRAARRIPARETVRALRCMALCQRHREAFHRKYGV